MLFLSLWHLRHSPWWILKIDIFLDKCYAYWRYKTSALVQTSVPIGEHFLFHWKVFDHCLCSVNLFSSKLCLVQNHLWETEWTWFCVCLNSVQFSFRIAPPIFLFVLQSHWLLVEYIRYILHIDSSDDSVLVKCLSLVTVALDAIMDVIYSSLFMNFVIFVGTFLLDSPIGMSWLWFRLRRLCRYDARWLWGVCSIGIYCKMSLKGSQPHSDSTLK